MTVGSKPIPPPAFLAKGERTQLGSVSLCYLPRPEIGLDDTAGVSRLALYLSGAHPGVDLQSPLHGVGCTSTDPKTLLS